MTWHILNKGDLDLFRAFLDYNIPEKLNEFKVEYVEGKVHDMIALDKEGNKFILGHEWTPAIEALCLAATGDLSLLRDRDAMTIEEFQARGFDVQNIQAGEAWEGAEPGWYLGHVNEYGDFDEDTEGPYASYTEARVNMVSYLMRGKYVG